MNQHRWHGALEGYYGPPLSATDRLEFVQWLGSVGGTTFVYAPKHDPLQRDRWREPYDPAQLATFAELIAAGRDAGVEVGFVVSPGLDWSAGDGDALAAKLRAFYDIGARQLGVAFDDVPPGGADLGRMHGEAVAGAVAALPDDVRWASCPTDYAVTMLTPYLTAYGKALPVDVDVMWTGPSIVSPAITAADAADLSASLGHRLVLAENFPVNDGPMSGVLHLGPYPVRDRLLPSTTAGALMSLLPMPRASRIGVECGLRWWADPTGDREATWRAVVAGVPGLEPIARACRSWLTDPGPDAELAQWADAAFAGDTRLVEWLARGCRTGLDDAWQVELDAWLRTWEWEAFAMAFVLYGLRAPRNRHTELAFATAEGQRRLRMLERQTFGIRYALYPVTRWEADAQVPDRGGLVVGENLTDMICRRALDITFGGTP